jgi:hypothetical protein
MEVFLGNRRTKTEEAPAQLEMFSPEVQELPEEKPFVGHGW